MLDPDMVHENLFGDASSADVREQCDLAWLSMTPYEQAVALDAAFILDATPIENTMMRDAYDRMSIHTRATLAHQLLSRALEHDTKVRTRIVAQIEKLRGELEQTREVWERAEALTDVLIGDRA